MLQRLGILAAFPLLAGAACGQDVVDLARKAPPELFADAVVKLIERGQIPAGTPRRALLEEAFQAAKQAKEPVKLMAMPQFADRRPGLRQAALRAGLDTLSLEARAVALMAETDADRARELFQSIQHPALEVRTCEDPMIADDSAYFEMASKVTGVNLLAVVGPGNAPGELAGFAKVLLKKALSKEDPLSPDDFRLLEGALALKMQTAAPDYRAFTITADDLKAALDGLAARARELGVSVDTLAEGARKLAVNQLSSPRCHEEFGGATGFVAWFNATWFSLGEIKSRAGAELTPIVQDQIIAKADLGSAKAESYFSKESDKELANQFQQLRAARGKPEWNGRLQDFLAKYAAWKPAGEAIDVFHQQMIVAHGLYELMPPGEERDKVAARVVEFLKGNAVEREYPAEWLAEVRSFTEFELADKAKLLEAFRDSGDPGLALFAALSEARG